MIKKIVVGNKKFEYPLFLFEYLYSYIFRFSLEYNLSKGQDILEIPVNLLTKFNASIKLALSDLLLNHYEEPNHKRRSKYGSRYQKIIFDGKIYVVDFRTDPFGNTSYGIYLLLTWLNKLIEEHDLKEEE